MTQFGHGQSNPTYKIECLPGNDASSPPLLPLATFVLRKKPPGKILASAHAVEREFAAMRALRGSPVPVPAALCLCEDAATLGTPFYLMSHAAGRVFVSPGLEDLPTPAHRTAVYREMARVLGALHRVDPDAVGLRAFGRPDRYSARQVERWARQYELSDPPPDERAVRDLIAWLRANVPASEPSGRIVHGDYRLDNLVFGAAEGPGADGPGAGAAAGGVVAVLDWELATIGCPYSDVAYNCMPYHLPPAEPGAHAAYPAFAAGGPPAGVPSEREYVRWWAEAANLPNPTEARGGGAKSAWPFYVALSLFRGAAILAGVRHRAAMGNASAPDAAKAGTLVQTLANRALVVAGVGVPGGVPIAPREMTSSSRAKSSYVPLAPIAPGLEPSEKAAGLLVKLRAFMARHAFPAEAALERHAASETRWTSVSPVVEELKALAKRAGLWNLWLPLDSADLLKLGDADAGDTTRMNATYSASDRALMRGPGLTNLEYAHLAREMGASVYASEFFNCSAPDTGNMEVLLRYGTPAQQRTWLAPLLLGEIRSCFAMTEPAVASSDATNIEAAIRSDGAEFYVLDGKKWWTSGACDPRCAVAIFMGKTAPDGTPGVPKHRQQSMVLVPMDAPGVSVDRPLTVFGYDDAPHGHAVTTFRGVRVRKSDALLLGEGRGFEIAQGRLGPGRLHHCMRLLGMGERALRLAARRARERTAFGRTLAENGATMQTLGRCRVALEGARLATLDAARRLDNEGNKAAKGAIAACKVAAPRAALEVIDAAIQIHGGLGVSDDAPLARMYAGARTLRLADGPDEVHLETIARMEVRRAKM